MIEATASSQTRTAMAAAHASRGKALRDLAATVRNWLTGWTAKSVLAVLTR